MNVCKITAILILSTAPAVAMEWLSADELERSCDAFLADSTDSDATPCLAFMQGFLAGTEARPATDGVESVKPNASTSESFSERATRTRLGTIRLMQLRSSDKPDYCIDESLSAVEIVESVARYLEDHEEVLQLTNAEAVYAALVHEYPCDP